MEDVGIYINGKLLRGIDARGADLNSKGCGLVSSLLEFILFPAAVSRSEQIPSLLEISESHLFTSTAHQTY